MWLFPAKHQGFNVSSVYPGLLSPLLSVPPELHIAPLPITRFLSIAVSFSISMLRFPFVSESLYQFLHNYVNVNHNVLKKSLNGNYCENWSRQLKWCNLEIVSQLHIVGVSSSFLFHNPKFRVKICTRQLVTKLVHVALLQVWHRDENMVGSELKLV